MDTLTRDRALMTARRHAAIGEYELAMRLCRRLLRERTDDHAVLHLVGGLLLMHGDPDEATQTLVRAINCGARDPRVFCDLAAAHRLAGRIDLSLETLERAAQLAPSSIDVLASRIETLAFARRADDAAALLEPYIASGQMDARVAAAFAEIAPDLGREDECVSMLERAANDATLTPYARSTIHFRMARLLDRLRRPDAAFRAARIANDLADSRFDCAVHAAAIDAHIQQWSRDRVASIPSSGASTDRPVFILGLPRSGAGLVERILAAHPEGASAGENSEFASVVRRLCGTDTAPLMLPGDNHSATLMREEAERFDSLLGAVDLNATRVADRSANNYLYAGLISRLFPNAHIIHCTRDPLDIGLSCFFRDFYGPYHWANSLAGIAGQLVGHQRVLDHWSALGTPMLTVHFEDLVEDSVVQVHRLLEFVGLDWSADCLSALDVRPGCGSGDHSRPRSSHIASIGRWRRYATQLQPLRAAVDGKADTGREGAAA